MYWSAQKQHHRILHTFQRKVCVRHKYEIVIVDLYFYFSNVRANISGPSYMCRGTRWEWWMKSARWVWMYVQQCSGDWNCFFFIIATNKYSVIYMPCKSSLNNIPAQEKKEKNIIIDLLKNWKLIFWYDRMESYFRMNRR